MERLHSGGSGHGQTFGNVYHAIVLNSINYAKIYNLRGGGEQSFVFVKTLRLKNAPLPTIRLVKYRCSATKRAFSEFPSSPVFRFHFLPMQFLQLLLERQVADV